MKCALKGQYHAGLWMLREAIELCPEESWIAGAPPRPFWRIAYHTVFYTHLYLQNSEADFVPWRFHRKGAPSLWDDEDQGSPFSKEDVLAYLDFVDTHVDQALDDMDLSRQESGFDWYPIPKLDHQLVNLRHIQGHVGQLSELLMAQGIETRWKAIALNAVEP